MPEGLPTPGLGEVYLTQQGNKPQVAVDITSNSGNITVNWLDEDGAAQTACDIDVNSYAAGLYPGD